MPSGADTLMLCAAYFILDSIGSACTSGLIRRTSHLRALAPCFSLFTFHFVTPVPPWTWVSLRRLASISEWRPAIALYIPYYRFLSYLCSPLQP